MSGGPDLDLDPAGVLTVNLGHAFKPRPQRNWFESAFLSLKSAPVDQIQHGGGRRDVRGPCTPEGRDVHARWS